MNSRARSFCFILIAAGILPATNHTGAPAALAGYPHRNQTAESAKDTAAQARPKGESFSETAARSAPPSKKITERRRLSEYGEDAGESQSDPSLSGARSDKFRSALGGSNDARSTPDLAVDGPNAFDTLGKVTDGLTRTAQSGEPACGPGAGDCCSSNGTPGCEDVDCCNDICVADPFCCDGFWDVFCAAAAEGNPLCNEGSCGDPACGPGAGDCCSSNGTPGCDDEDCCNCICACDPFCCGNEPLGFWDSLCAGQGFNPGCGASNENGLCTAECSECLPVGDGDECEDCIPVGEGVHANTTADNTGAADDSSCGLDDVVDEWYCYTAGCTGTATAKTCQDVSVPFNDSVLAVFEAPCGGAEIACDDDGCGAPNGFLSEVSWSVVAGNTYNIRVSAWDNGQGGDYLLEIICQLPPENDDCAGAIPVAVPSTTSGSTTGALPDSAPFCGTSDGTGGAVWYSVLGTGNTITATTCDSTNGDFCTGGGSANYDTKIRVYTEGCAALNCEAGNDDNCTGGSSGLRSTVSWCSTEGTEYLILVHGFGGNEGNFVLEVCDDGVGCGAGPDCPLSSCEGSTATVTQSNTTSNGNNRIACGAGGNTTENGWARCYDLAAEGVSEDLTINSVTFGVQQATIDGIDVNVNLYLDSDGCPPGEPGVDAILLDSVSTVVNTADEGSLITLNFPGGPVAPAGSTLIVEIEAPADGTVEPLHAFRAMSNPDGQCGGSYLRAASCGFGGWVDLADIGFPDAHLVQIVNGTSDCGCQSDGECDDGDACTDDTCVDGGCVHTPVDCSGAGDQCNTASCDPNGVEGNCDILTPVANGTPCSDGDACTENDQCTAGSCGGAAVDCSRAGDQCNTASCDPNGAEGNCDILRTEERRGGSEGRGAW
ncbi:MAG: hypothetical protein O7D91_02915, partial [Planctomycetota bacterium]|nr:hypothetical protein [Planctomycetota bacterium]